MRLNKEQTFWLLMYILLMSITSYCTYYVLNVPDPPCKLGTVIDKKQPENLSMNKSHGTLTIKNSMVIKYYDGQIEEINPSENLFYNRKIGDNVCIEQCSPRAPFIILLGMVIGDIISVIFHLALLCNLIRYLYGYHIADDERYHMSRYWEGFDD